MCTQPNEQVELSTISTPMVGPSADKEISQGTVASATVPMQQASHPCHFVQGFALGHRNHYATQRAAPRSKDISLQVVAHSHKR